MMAKRVFLVVLDSFGIGEAPDSADYGDKGSNTLRSLYLSGALQIPNLVRLGLYNIKGVQCGMPNASPTASYARMQEASVGKDTTIGHWEIAGVISDKPMPTYPNGFPEEILSPFRERTGRGILCNKPYSGTKVIMDYGQEHLETGDLIVYTSADSVFQIAAHEDVVPIEELYRYCETARGLLQGKHGVGRVIARPFSGSYPNFKRLPQRHDFSIAPPKKTILDALYGVGQEVFAIGKIYDIFAGVGIRNYVRTSGNKDGMNRLKESVQTDFSGLCFTNLVDFDMLYGHRNNIAGYTHALNEFDSFLSTFLPLLKKDDVLIITADHGCDPATPSTDHSREYTPMLIYGDTIRAGVNLGTRHSFADIGATVADLLHVYARSDGSSFYDQVIR